MAKYNLNENEFKMHRLLVFMRVLGRRLLAFMRVLQAASCKDPEHRCKTDNGASEEQECRGDEETDHPTGHHQKRALDVNCLT